MITVTKQIFELTSNWRHQRLRQFFRNGSSNCLSHREVLRNKSFNHRLCEREREREITNYYNMNSNETLHLFNLTIENFGKKNSWFQLLLLKYESTSQTNPIGLG